MRIRETVLLPMLLAILSPAGLAEEVKFRKVVLDRTFRSEGVALADINRDGKLDVLAGEVWYAAPNWQMHELLPPGKYDGATGYSQTFANFACDVNRDGWTDSVITTMMGEPSRWYENPQGRPGHWKIHLGTRSACNETPLFADLLGNGKPVGVWAVQPEGYIAWFSLPEDPAQMWDMHIVAGPKAPGSSKHLPQLQFLALQQEPTRPPDKKSEQEVEEEGQRSPGSQVQGSRKWEEIAGIVGSVEVGDDPADLPPVRSALPNRLRTRIQILVRARRYQGGCDPILAPERCKDGSHGGGEGGGPSGGNHCGKDAASLQGNQEKIAGIR